VALAIAVSATDIDGDDLTFQLNPDGAPLDAVIEQTGPTTAVIRWTPAEGDAGQTIAFRVLVTDDGVPPLADAESFDVLIGQLPASRLPG